jgi:hypothetical protein
MASQVNAILIHDSDNVVTTLAEIQAGECARYRVREGILEVVARDRIPAFHKLAVQTIYRMEMVRKYGEVIGQAVADIRAGDHVHTHNIVSPGSAQI